MRGHIPHARSLAELLKPERYQTYNINQGGVMKAVGGFGVLMACVLLSGCGIREQTVRIHPPATSIVSPDAPGIVIGAITDARTPDPTLNLSVAAQTRNVGGSAHSGNGIAVNLESRTVTDTMRQIVASSLQNAGYRLLQGAQGAPRVDVRITQFEVKMPFQFWRAAFYNARMLADITADVTITTPTGTRTFTVSGHGYNVYQRVVAQNWQIALDKAVADFSNNLRAQAIEARQ